MEFVGKWRSVKVENAEALFNAMVPIPEIRDKLLAHHGSNDMTDEFEITGDKMHRKTHFNGKLEYEITAAFGEEFDYETPMGVAKIKVEKLAENKIKVTDKGDQHTGCLLGTVDGDTLTYNYTVEGQEVTMTRTLKRQ